MTVPEEQNFSLDHFCVPDHYKDDLSHVMLPHGMIIDRIERMAVDICRDYGFNHGSGERLHMLCILKGGHQFFSDLSGARSYPAWRLVHGSTSLATSHVAARLCCAQTRSRSSRFASAPRRR